MSNDIINFKVNILKQVFECLRTYIYTISSPTEEISIYSSREDIVEGAI